MIGELIGVAVALVLIGGLVVVHRRRVRRASGRHPDAWFVGAVAGAPNSIGTRMLVVDADGVRLLRPAGTKTHGWTWDEVKAVRTDWIRHRAGVTWPGVVVDVDSRWEPELRLISDPVAGGGTGTARAEAAAAAIERGLQHHGADR